MGCPPRGTGPIWCPGGAGASRRPSVSPQHGYCYLPRRAAARHHVDDVIDQDAADLEVSRQADEEDVVDLTRAADGDDVAPVIKLVNLLIYNAIRSKASDIHIEPFEKRICVRYRVDGRLQDAMERLLQKENVDPSAYGNSAVIEASKKLEKSAQILV